jgi:NADH:ubiquinone oxidoreductase subunit E
MEKISLKICTGTMCYVMGGAELRAMLELLPDDIMKRISVSYSPCMGLCSDVGEPPYIQVNGKTISGVSKSNLMQILKEALSDAVR